MVGQENMEDDDEDDLDFNPFLQRSPSVDGEESGESWKGDELYEEVEGDDVVVRQEDGILEREVVPIIRGSEHLIGQFDGADTFFELASDDNEEEDCEDEEQEKAADDCNFASELELDGVDTDHHHFNDVRKPSKGKYSSPLSTRIAHGSQDKPEKNLKAPFLKNGKDSVESLRCYQSGERGEEIMDAISKRTRARYSLADMSLDELEMFLQESDEEEYFQNVDDEEEYRKFLVAVQESNHIDENREKESKKGDEDDEEDVDFEVEIEETLESDETSASLRRRKRRRPDTREKRRQRTQLQIKRPNAGQSTAPLRHLLPNVGNLTDDGLVIDKLKTRVDTANSLLPPHVKKNTPVNGFTAHQIGQLYCLIHEHVQLLVQVFSLCVLDPLRQQIATDTHGMLKELVEKRELLLSWKKSAFPEFCFRPPYTHPSLVEDKYDSAPCFPTLTPSESSSFSITSCDQNALGSLDVYHGYSSRQESVPDVSSSMPCTKGLLQNIAVASSLSGVQEHIRSNTNVDLPSPSSSSLIGLERISTSTHSYGASQHSQSWQGIICPFTPSMPIPDYWEKNNSAADCVILSQPRILPGPSYNADHDVLQQATGSIDNSTCVSLKSSDLCGPPSGNVSVDEVSFCQENPSSLPQALLPATAEAKGPLSNASLPTESVPMSKPRLHLVSEEVNCKWAPVTSGPVRSLLDVAPLALVREFLTDISRVVQDYRQRHVETGPNHNEREPLFAVSAVDEQNQNVGRQQSEGTRAWLLGSGEIEPAFAPRSHIKKTMAAVLVESTKKQSLALVPKDAAVAVQRFLPYFNKAFFPHKPPPVATASRLLFTDAEDELLAMGLMMYNTDWKAIQQRFLPSKSMHQIFVRQKNRSSARAPENSIKAVRRMKSSPLTSTEKTSIQEGLGLFKYDWSKVWQYCVPYRDPAVLPRQWRIAVGTQKSYKTSETSKERRRLYEANRRQLIAAKKAIDKVLTKEDADPSCMANPVESRDERACNEDADDMHNAYIREAFLADWCPRSIPSISASLPLMTSSERQKRGTSSLLRKRKAKAELKLNFLSPSGSGAMKAICQNRKQTVKLAPGLPPVKLPPRVHVLSQYHVQNQQPFPTGTRFKPVASQGLHMTGQTPGKLKLTQVPSFLSSSWSPHQLNLQMAVSASHGLHVPCSRSVHRQRQNVTPITNLPPAKSSQKESTRGVVQGPTEAVDKKSVPVHLPPSLESTKKIESSQQYPHSEDFSGCIGSSPIQRPDTVPVESRKKQQAAGTDQSRSLCHIQITSTVPPISENVPVGIVQHLPSCDDAMTCVSDHSQISDFHGSIMACPSLSVLQAKWAPTTCLDSDSNSERPSPIEVFRVREVQTDLTESQKDNRNCQAAAYPGHRKTNRDCTKGKRILRKDIKVGTREILSSTVTGRVDSEPLSVGVIHDVPRVNVRCRSRNGQRSQSKKRVEDVCVVTRWQEPYVEQQHVIVMEQEELSDSEEEADTGVLFEHEEMGDSDRDGELEHLSVKHLRACKSR